MGSRSTGRMSFAVPALLLAAVVVGGVRATFGEVQATSPAARPAGPAATRPAPPAASVPAAERLAFAARLAYGDADPKLFLTGRMTASLDMVPPVGGPMAVTATDTFGPGKLRREIASDGPADVRAGLGPATMRATYLWDADKSYTSNHGEPFREVPQTAAALPMFPAPYLASLDVNAAVKSPTMTVREDRWDGAAAVVVRIEKDGVWVGDLAFDAASARLVGGRKPLPAAKASGVENSTTETHYSDFRDVRGATLPMTYTALVNGKLYTRVRVTEFRPLTEVDPALFRPSSTHGTAPAR
jgi:hypothetical protein